MEKKIYKEIKCKKSESRCMCRKVFIVHMCVELIKDKKVCERLTYSRNVPLVVSSVEL